MIKLSTILRVLLRNPLQTVLISLGLILAITASTFILGWITYERSFDDFYPTDLYRVTVKYTSDTGVEQEWARVNVDWINELESEFPEIEELVRFQSFRPRNVVIGKQSFKESHAYAADSEVFNVLDLTFIEGNRSALAAPFSVVLTRSTAIKYFGSVSAAMGRQIALDSEPGKANYLVKGVIEDHPSNTHIPVTLISSINKPTDRTGWAYVYLKIPDPDKIDGIQASLPEFIAKYEKENAENITLKIQSIQDIYLNSHANREIIPSGQPKLIKIFQLVIAFLVGIAGANFIIYMSSRILSRSRIYSLHKILGASKSTLTLHILLEVLLLLLFSLLISAGLVSVLKPFAVHYFTTQFDITVKVFSIIGTFFSLFILVAVMIYVSLFRRFRTQLRTFDVVNKGKLGIRELLLSLQFALTFALLFSFLFIHNQLRFMLNSDQGLDYEKVIAITDFHTEVSDELPQFKSEIQTIPSVHSSSGVMELPSRAIRDEGTVALDGLDNGNIPAMDIQIVDYDFWKTLAVKFIAGGNFPKSISSQDGFDYPTQSFDAYINSRRQAYIINETAAEMLGFKSPDEALDHSINWSNGFFDLKQGEIVGVVADYHQEGLSEDIDPTVFIYEPVLYGNLLVKVQSDDYEQLLTQLKEKWHARFGSIPFQYSFLDQEYQRLYEKEQSASQLLSAFTAIAMFILMLGLAGILIFEFQRRMKDLAIRKVLGAYFTDIMSWMTKPYLAMMGAAVVLILPLIYLFMNDWLQGYAYQADLSVWIFLLPVVFILSIFLLISVVIVRRYSSINPVELLKDE